VWRRQSLRSPKDRLQPAQAYLGSDIISQSRWHGSTRSLYPAEGCALVSLPAVVRLIMLKALLNPEAERLALCPDRANERPCSLSQDRQQVVRATLSASRTDAGRAPAPAHDCEASDTDCDAKSFASRPAAASAATPPPSRTVMRSAGPSLPTYSGASRPNEA